VIIRFPGHVAIGSDCSIGSGSSLTAEREDAKLTIEDNVIINPDVHLDFTGDLRIGRNSLISPDVTVFTHSHGHDPRSKAVKTPLQIGESVWIGANTTICEGVGFIAANSIIAAGAVVTKEIREPGVYAGVPAKLVRSRVNGSAEF
jgi:acetyltransferase-like isoleucine patch superfamily enzyme